MAGSAPVANRSPSVPSGTSYDTKRCVAEGRSLIEPKMPASQITDRTCLMPSDDEDRERRLRLLINRLPPRIRRAVIWLRRPEARWLRIPAGLLLTLGGCLAIRPVFGVWMLPLGIVLLAEDVPPLRRFIGRVLEWVERRHPRWMGSAP